MKSTIKVPIVAIRGINKEKCRSVVENGADSPAAISAVVYSDDVRKETRKFIKFINIIRK